MEATCRIARAEDEARLKEIWLAAYPEESAQFLELYFSTCFRPERAVVCETSRGLTSAIHILPGMMARFPQHPPLQLPYLYALGTPPQFRGQGWGGAAIAASARIALEQGGDFAAFQPASPSLAAWYAGFLGTKDRFWARKHIFPRNALPSPCLNVRAVTPEEYYHLRETLLTDTPHIEFPLYALKLQADICRFSSGGLFALEGIPGCAAVEVDGDTLVLRELLAPGQEENAAAALMARFPTAMRCVLSAPAFWEGVGAVSGSVVVCAHPHREFPSVPNAYWGFTFE